jgi:hypothetical protein
VNALRWWVCGRCGRKLYEHTRIGGEYVCYDALSDEMRPFVSETRDVSYSPDTGLVPRR